MAIVLQEWFEPPASTGVDHAAHVSGGVRLGDGIAIEAGAVIDSDVTIGDGTRIEANVRIHNGVTIGARCVIRSNSVIGGVGFGVVVDSSGDNLKVPHLGGVIIEDDVEIGALNTVVSGTLEPTVVGRGTKTDDHVHIAHNCQIGENCILTACAEMSGSASLGRGVWLGPNCSVMNGIHLGDDVFVGLGSCVTKSFGRNLVLAGNPAKRIRTRFSEKAVD